MTRAGAEPLRNAVEVLAGEPSVQARRRYFEAHRQLHAAEFGRVLMIGVHRKLRVDLDQAQRLAEALDWLAVALASEELRAKALRAEAHILYFRRGYREAIARYERAIAIFKRLGLETEEAITHSSAIGAISHLGDFDRASRWGERARRVFEKTGDRLRLARLDLNLGHVLARRDRFREALECYQAAHGGFLEAGTPMDIGAALRNIAVCHQDLNEFDAAVAAYEEARAYCRRHDLPLIGLEVEYNIAYLYYLRGEYGRAIRLFETARASCERHDDLHHAALCDLDLAEIYLELNLVDEAARLAERAYHGFDRLGMDYETAKALTYRALAAYRKGDADAALQGLERAHRRFAAQENRMWMALVDLHRAMTLADHGRSLEAHRLARRAVEAFRRERLPAKISLCEILLARLDIAAGEPERGREQCREALRRLEPLGLPSLEFQAHQVIGQAEEALGRREQALAAYRRSHETLESLRSHLRLEELKISFLEDKLSLYEGLVALALERDDTPEARASAFAWIERAKSRSLADQLALGASEAPGPKGDGGPAAELRSLRERLNSLYRMIDQEEMRGPDRSRARLARLRRETDELERQIQRLLRKIQSSDREFGVLQGSVTADLDTIRPFLPPGTRLLEFFIARGTIYAFLVDADGLTIEPVAADLTVRQLHHQLQFQLSKFRLGRDYVDRYRDLIDTSTRSILQSLYEELMAPIADGLDVEHLVVVPHGFLHYLPFSALHDGERYLLDRFSISCAPSATVFHLCGLREPRVGGPALVLGVADERAPHILHEARAVAEMLPGARLFLGDEATRERLVQLGRDCRFLHVATHGLYRRDNPLFSALQLGDARLSLLDLYGLRLGAELAVLSGCGTGLSSVRGGDELVGLTRGLLYAGAASVLVTLWDLHDESAARLMRALYRRLQDDPSPSRALRQAALELREQDPHPYFWAPFVLIGRPHGYGAL